MFDKLPELNKITARYIPKQKQVIFFDDGDNPHLPSAPTAEEVRSKLSENNSKCPLNDVVVSEANRGNMRILRRFAFTALSRFNHSCRGCNFGIYSPPGQGKTFVVKKWAETIGLPFIFVQSPALKSTTHLFEMISDEFKKIGIEIVSQTGRTDYVIPPCIVFFDEAHKLNTNLTKGALLNAMEPDDGIMSIQTADGTKSVNCYEVCWVAATTERGDLFDAFESRLTTAIEWLPSEGSELTRIVRAGLLKKVQTHEINMCPPIEICELIGKYQSSPRLAIHGFGVKVVQQKNYMPSCTWEECCETVASDLGINKWGLSQKQVAILEVLGQRPVGENRLASLVQCREAQVTNMEMPELMRRRLVAVSTRGICLTRQGVKMLETMGIQHRGDEVTVEYLESR